MSLNCSIQNETQQQAAALSSPLSCGPEGLDFIFKDEINSCESYKQDRKPIKQIWLFVVCIVSVL